MEKKHQSERYRGGIQFVERWTNAKVAFVAFWAGHGYSYEAIAEKLSDGTKPSTIRRMRRLWRLPARRNLVTLSFDLTVKQRAHVFARAAQHSLPPEEFVRLLIIWATMPKDRFPDIVPKDHP